MSKKNNQWNIDRAFNLTVENEPKFRDILEKIYSIKKEGISYDAAIQKLIKNGSIGNKERYEQSTQTLFTNMGFMIDKETLTDVAEDYINDKITFIDLLLLQLFMKQYKRNESHMIRPLVVTLMVLNAIENDSSIKNYAWIDVYDYMTYLTEITDYSQIDSTFITKMVNDKKNADINRKVDDNKDADIWFNLFKTIKLFNQVGDKLCLNSNESEMIQFILNNHQNVPFITASEDWKTEYGKNSRGLMQILPSFSIDASSFNLTGIKDEAINKTFYEYLVLGKSDRNIDSEVFYAGNGNSKGFFSQSIRANYGIPASAKNVFGPFKSFPCLLRYSKDYLSQKDIIEGIIKATKCSQISKYKANSTGYNVIYYGAPGCGKSYLVKNELLPSLGITPNFTVRTTFYQDYSNSDFVGQILPKIEKTSSGTDVTYEFNPGPFAKALLLALKNKFVNVGLVIEELNRGNAASIFGDIFQLLDRDSDGSSTYKIINGNLQDYLSKELGYDVYSINIPSNLFIIATMNTSDQNVFTLDTAFKRRWKFEKIKNEFDKSKAYDKKLSQMYVPGMDGITWEEMVIAINKYIVANADQFMNEDKQIGIYFLDENTLVENKLNVGDSEKIKEFSYKILEYLWDDIAKYTDKSTWFKDVKTLDELIEAYKDHGKDVFNDDIFKK
mgnify:CR=1 FL=1